MVNRIENFSRVRLHLEKNISLLLVRKKNNKDEYLVPLLLRCSAASSAHNKDDFSPMVFSNKANKVGESQPQKDFPGNVEGSNGLIIKLNYNYNTNICDIFVI